MANIISSYGVPSTKMSFSPCKWERALSKMFDEGRRTVEISLRETGHASVASMKSSCQAALKRLGKGSMYRVDKSADGIIVSKAY